MSQQARTAKQIGAVIRRARRAASLTQAQLGSLIGRRQATISRLEAGQPAAQLQTVLDVLMALGLEIKVDRRERESAPDIEDLF